MKESDTGQFRLEGIIEEVVALVQAELEVLKRVIQKVGLSGSLWCKMLSLGMLQSHSRWETVLGSSSYRSILGFVSRTCNTSFCDRPLQLPPYSSIASQYFVTMSHVT